MNTKPPLFLMRKNLRAFQHLFVLGLSVFCFFSLGSNRLDCGYLDRIQKSYLELHINYANYTDHSRSNRLFFGRFKKSSPIDQKKMRELEVRVTDQMIKTLDADKFYFTIGDVKNIKAWMYGFFSKIKRNDCLSLIKVYNVYLKRVKERVNFAKEFLSKKITLNTSIQILLDSEKRFRPNNLQAVNDFHTKYLHYQMANSIVYSEKEKYAEQIEDAKSKLLHSYNKILKDVSTWMADGSGFKKGRIKGFPSKGNKWYSLYLKSFSKALDPHSYYLSEEDHEDFEITMNLSLEGIGASLSSRYGYTQIEKLMPGGAAIKSGKLEPKDKIIAIGQSADKMVNIYDVDLREVVSMIRGKSGTAVYLKILRIKKKDKNAKNSDETEAPEHLTRQNERKVFTVRLVRSKVDLTEQAASIYYFDKLIEDKKHKIGIIRLPSFYGEGRRGGKSAAKDIKKLLEEAKRKNVAALVLDLTNNSGGSLPEAVFVSGLFIAKGAVVRQLSKTPQGKRFSLLSDPIDGVFYSGPLVILVNRASASASEIVSGTLQSYRRAVIVGGDHTFGKGSIQSVERLRGSLGSIKVTVGLFYVPNGYSTQLNGVVSDIPFPSLFSNKELGEVNLDYALKGGSIPSFISKSAFIREGHLKWEPLTKNIIEFLRKRSFVRINKSEKFSKIKEELQEIRRKAEEGHKISVADVFSEFKKAEKEKEQEKAKHLEAFNKSSNGKKLSELPEEKEKEMRYRQRADVLEAINVAKDIVYWSSLQEKEGA